MDTSLYTLTQKIRELINETWESFSLQKNKKHWNQLCSSLDVIRDTELVIEAYEQGAFPADDGEKYLRLYGLLQALVVQQKAVQHLGESLGQTLNLGKYPKLIEIRNIRNCSIGHPSKVDLPKTKPQSSHFVSRSTMSKRGFKLLSFYENGRLKFKNIFLENLLFNQRKHLATMLRKVIRTLAEERLAHMKKFANIKIESVFQTRPESLETFLNQICYAAAVSAKDPNRVVVGIAYLEQVKKILKNFDALLIERGLGISAYQGVECIYKEIKFDLRELEKYFHKVEHRQRNRISSRWAYRSACFLEKKLFELRDQTQGIDNEYARLGRK